MDNNFGSLKTPHYDYNDYLRHCPFCNGAAQFRRNQVAKGDDSDLRIECGKCGARTPIGRLMNKSELAMAWNQRGGKVSVSGGQATKDIPIKKELASGCSIRKPGLINCIRKQFRGVLFIISIGGSPEDTEGED